MPSCCRNAAIKELRADPLYLGLREAPPSETELDELVEESVDDQALSIALTVPIMRGSVGGRKPTSGSSKG
jgi:hypothetical protein